MATEETTILLTGYAPAPKGTVMQEKQRLFGVILEVDLRTHRIVDADVPGVTDLSRDFFKRIALGYDLSNGVEELCEKIRARYWATSTDSLVACLRLINQRYEEGMRRLALGTSLSGTAERHATGLSAAAPARHGPRQPQSGVPNLTTPQGIR